MRVWRRGEVREVFVLLPMQMQMQVTLSSATSGWPLPQEVQDCLAQEMKR